ncbi:hypothetical protein ACJX0J_015872, partial [Zea mays]
NPHLRNNTSVILFLVSTSNICHEANSQLRLERKYEQREGGNINELYRLLIDSIFAQQIEQNATWIAHMHLFPSNFSFQNFLARLLFLNNLREWGPFALWLISLEKNGNRYHTLMNIIWFSIFDTCFPYISLFYTIQLT